MPDSKSKGSAADVKGSQNFLLTTKLFTPQFRRNYISRPLLIEKLIACIQAKFNLISAPPGFGKTSLLSEWIKQNNAPIVWVSLDEGDNDPARFWAYLVAALQKVEAYIGKSALAQLQVPQSPPPELILTK